ncbi:hypothetical protein [Marinoscillum sp. MHG1-6]|uniref:hypothetical protein n=1 Tax=Marinoscillum sp. MHG1-6 TaxID=2959627 RepID=UPI002157A1E7|nr:hypothetical protein [Marinoscillum sp. MHG1-6]
MTKEIEFDILENGLDFILSSLRYLTNPESPSDLKYGILHLSAGTELVLKEKLKSEHWSLIFENVSKANKKDLLTGDFLSVNFETILLRLNNVCGIELSEKQSQNLRTLRQQRNRIEHFHFLGNPEAIKSITARALSTVISFIKHHISEETISTRSQEMLQSIRTISSDFEHFVSLRNSQIKKDIEEASKEHEILKCPRCLQTSVVLDEQIQCLFCGTENEAEEFANNYVRTFMYNDLYAHKKDGDRYPLEPCFNCGDSTLFENEKGFVCFTCLEKWDRDEIVQCSTCYNLCIKDGQTEEFEMCESCLNG